MKSNVHIERDDEQPERTQRESVYRDRRESDLRASWMAQRGLVGFGAFRERFDLLSSLQRSRCFVLPLQALLVIIRARTS